MKLTTPQIYDVLIKVLPSKEAAMMLAGSLVAPLNELLVDTQGLQATPGCGVCGQCFEDCTCKVFTRPFKTAVTEAVAEAAMIKCPCCKTYCDAVNPAPASRGGEPYITTTGEHKDAGNYRTVETGGEPSPSRDCGKCGSPKGSTIHAVNSMNTEIRMGAHEYIAPLHVSRETLREQIKAAPDAEEIEVAGSRGGEPELPTCHIECSCKTAHPAHVYGGRPALLCSGIPPKDPTNFFPIEDVIAKLPVIVKDEIVRIVGRGGETPLESIEKIFNHAKAQSVAFGGFKEKLIDAIGTFVARERAQAATEKLLEVKSHVTWTEVGEDSPKPLDPGLYWWMVAELQKDA